MPDFSIEPVLQVRANAAVAGGVSRHAGAAAGHIRGTLAAFIHRNQPWDR